MNLPKTKSMSEKSGMPRPSVGGILLADPFLLDSYFKRSAVLLVKNDENGSLGFILNKQTDVLLNDAVEDFPDFDTPLYFGGPVETDTLFYVHTIGPLLDGAKEIVPGIWWGGDYDQLKLLIDTHQVQENQIRFYAGYSGWKPKELNTEIKDSAWYVCQNESSLEKWLFKEKAINLWSTILSTMGNEGKILSNCPDDPNLN